MKKYLLLLSLFFIAAFTFTSCDLFDPEDEEDDGDNNGTVYTSLTIESNVSWSKNTYIIDGRLSITNGGHLTIAPGSVLKFHSGAEIYVSGANSALTANGTVDQPITFTSVSNTPAAGDWDYIGFDAEASGNSSMQYCIVEYAGGYADYYGGAIWNEGARISVDNCIIRYSGCHGVVCEDEGYFTSFTNNTLTDNAAYDVEIQANYAHTIGTGNVISGKGVFVTSDDVEGTDVTWGLQTAPYVIASRVEINSANGAKLTIAAGNTIQFASGAEMVVGNDGYGTLIAQGTEDMPILFTSTSVQKQPGQWDYIAFESGATSNSLLDHCIIEAGGGYADYTGAIDIEESYISITNTEIRTSASFGITLDGSAYFNSFYNNNIHDCASYAMEIYGKYAHTIGTGNVYGATDKIKVLGSTISQTSVTWVAQSTPYVIDGTLKVESASGSTLNIEPGTVIHFTEGSEIMVGYSDFGKLVANGTAASPIIFTTAAPSGGEQPGQWDGIFFYANTLNGALLNYCEISYGGGYASSYNNGNVNLNDVPMGLPIISNSTISYSAGWGIYSEESSPDLENNTFINNNLGDIGNKKGMIK